MYYRNQHHIIEIDDIEQVEHLHLAKEGEQTVAYIKATLDPHKNYQAEEEVHLHFTNGVNHRTFGPFKHAEPITLPGSDAEPAEDEEHQTGELEGAG
jgi:hypothetical protein